MYSDKTIKVPPTSLSPEMSVAAWMTVVAWLSMAAWLEVVVGGKSISTISSFSFFLIL